MSLTFGEKLAAALPALNEHWTLFYAKGCVPPVSNELNVVDTYAKFLTDFIPQCPIIDPRGVKVKIQRFNFPKFLNLDVKPGYQPKKPSTIVELIESGRFNEEEYVWASDRIEALFWVPDIIRNPDAIFKKKQDHGWVKADEVYVKVYDLQQKTKSKVKVVFVDKVGKHKDVIFVSSYLTAAHTAVKYCDGEPIWPPRK